MLIRMNTLHIREWAAEAGMECPARGRIPIPTLDAYGKANGFELEAAEDGQALIPPSGWPLVVRTDFSDETDWLSICEWFGSSFGYCQSRLFADLNATELLERLPKRHPHRILVVADAFAFHKAERSLLVLDVGNQPGRQFRAIPAAVKVVAHSISQSMLDFSSFADQVDPDGILRLY